MPRLLRVLVIAALVCSCGRPPGGEDQNTSPDSQMASATLPISSSPQDGELATDLPAMSGRPGVNNFVKLAVTKAGFDPAAPKGPAGLRYFAVELRGVARSRNNDFALEIRPFVFAQNEHGCISRPELDAPWLQQPLGEVVVFSAAKPTEGRLAFLVPEDTRHLRVLVSPSGDDGLIVPAGEDFTPTWPAPPQTIEDGSTLRVLLLPTPGQPPALPPPTASRENVVLDLVIENLKSDQGIEFTTSQQLRLVDPTGSFVQPSALTQQIGCRLDDGDVIPPGHARRFQAVYDMPAGAPKRLQYRGFEVDEITVDLP